VVHLSVVVLLDKNISGVEFVAVDNPIELTCLAFPVTLSVRSRFLERK
jgi:hypothetical protein